MVTRPDRGLLHRIFTLTPLYSFVVLPGDDIPAVIRSGHFLWHSLSPGPFYPGILPVRKHGALCCPDFPLQLNLNILSAVSVQKQRQNELLFLQRYELSMNSLYLCSHEGPQLWQ